MSVNKPKRPDVNPKNVTIRGGKFKEISRSDLDSLVKWIMENEYVECHTKPDVEIPDFIEYPSYDSALSLAIYEITGHWLDNPDSFLEGKSLFKSEKSDTWWAMEGFRVYHR